MKSSTVGRRIVVRLDLEEMLRSIPKDQSVPVLLLTQPTFPHAVEAATSFLDGKNVSYVIRNHGTVGTMLGANDIYFLAAKDYIYGVIPDPQAILNY